MKKFIGYQLEIQGIPSDFIFAGWDDDRLCAEIPESIYGGFAVGEFEDSKTAVFIGKIYANTAKECNQIYSSLKSKIKECFVIPHKGAKLNERMKSSGNKLW